MADDQGFTYKEAGVDVEAGNRAVDLMKQRLKSTQHPLVLGGLGGFGGAMRLPKPPSPPSTSGCCVLLSRCFMRSTARLPASTSTPASLYVNPWSSAIVLPRRCDGAS